MIWMADGCCEDVKTVAFAAVCCGMMVLSKFKIGGSGWFPGLSLGCGVWLVWSS